MLRNNPFQHNVENHVFFTWFSTLTLSSVGARLQRVPAFTSREETETSNYTCETNNIVAEQGKYLNRDKVRGINSLLFDHITPLAIRQSVIANLLKAGKDIRAVQVFAGHKSPMTTERYQQTGIEELTAAVLKFPPLG